MLPASGFFRKHMETCWAKAEKILGDLTDQKHASTHTFQKRSRTGEPKMLTMGHRWSQSQQIIHVKNIQHIMVLHHVFSHFDCVKNHKKHHEKQKVSPASANFLSSSISVQTLVNTSWCSQIRSPPRW